MIQLDVSEVPIEIQRRAHNEWSRRNFGFGHGRWPRMYRHGRRGYVTYNGGYHSEFIWYPLRKEGWMRNAIRSTLLCMMAVALIALGVAVGVGESYVLIARVLVGVELGILAILLFWLASD